MGSVPKSHLSTAPATIQVLSIMAFMAVAVEAFDPVAAVNNVHSSVSSSSSSSPAQIHIPDLGNSRPGGGSGGSVLSFGSAESFMGRKLVDPATSIFVSNKYDDDSAASENMARYFFFNSNVGSFNTSVSFTIPLFSFSMPDFSGSLLNDLGINTLFSLAVLGILFFGGLALLPFIFAYYGAGTLLPFFGGRSMDGGMGGGLGDWASTLNEYWTTSDAATRTAAAVEAAVAKFASAVGDHCAKRTVCEAHSSRPSSAPKEEGDDDQNELPFSTEDDDHENPMAMPIRALFPVPNLESGEYLEDMTLTPFQVAALYGRTKGADCGGQYRLCFFSMLDASTSMANLLTKAFKNLVRRR